jgi:hypothetical protein
MRFSLEIFLTARDSAHSGETHILLLILTLAAAGNTNQLLFL